MKGQRKPNIVCVVHPLDPRGEKVGGIETHVKLMLRRAPAASEILMIGVDGRGDLKLGQVTCILVEGREINFMPVVYYPDSDVNFAAKKLIASLTLRFALGLLRHYVAIARALHGRSATIELERYEFSALLAPLGRPIVQVVHGDASRNLPMDSLIKRYWVIHRLNEELAIRLASAIVCVNPAIKVKMDRSLGRTRKQVVFMPVPVDAELFDEKPFDLECGIFRVVFAGRLDQFKDPALMFDALYSAHERLGGHFEFHYIGTSDPHRYPEFSKIEDFTIRHGFRTPSEVAALMATCHCGILTSIFEGMPCFLLETLSVGRPFVAVHLPQYELVLEAGISGYMVDRGSDRDAVVADLAKHLVRIWQDIQDKSILPDRVRNKTAPFTSERLLSEHFSLHSSLVGQYGR